MNSKIYKVVVAVMVMSLGMSACMDKQPMLSKADMKAKADSIVNTKIPDLSRMAKEDLDYRSAIEVKVKADSIIQAKQKHSGPDTLKKTK